MSIDPALYEPSPFGPDPDDPDGTVAPRRPRPWEPYLPMTQAELDSVMASPPHLRILNPYLCAFNVTADDGVGYLSGMHVSCRVRVADPTVSRYCLEHQRELGIDNFSPSETSEATHKEVAGSLTRIVPKAVRTLELVMDDEDAPAGVRAKAADSILDRTGYAKGVDVRVDARVAVIDVREVLGERLAALKDAHLKGVPVVTVDPTETAPASPVLPTLTGEMMDLDGHPNSFDDDGGDDRPVPA